MFSNLALAPASTTSTASNSTDAVTFVIVGIVVVALFLGIVIRILRRNRLNK